MIRLGAPTIEGVMLTALLVGLAAFTIAFAYLLTLRLRVGRLEERAVQIALAPRIGARPAGNPAIDMEVAAADSAGDSREREVPSRG